MRLEAKLALAKSAGAVHGVGVCSTQHDTGNCTDPGCHRADPRGFHSRVGGAGCVGDVDFMLGGGARFGRRLQDGGGFQERGAIDDCLLVCDRWRA